MKQSREFIASALLYLPVGKIHALRDQYTERPWSEYVAEIKKVLDEHGSLNACQIAMLSLGMTKDQALSLIQSSNSAGKTRNRKPSKSSAFALVKAVQAESNKKLWNKGWEWLCAQASNRSFVGEFSPEEVSGKDVIRFSYGEAVGVSSIKKATFRDYWGRDSLSKKVQK